eukprot:TRINITY_DN634_c0_g1_i1.p1 TRINITY_DN634_c0_g1~~TRINITY_DN634_c0_g1_i1.p1  ORF type:complete len:836 (-),score=178.75 TRINITY_DN634_c0_g1_i1:120-2627(-)
MPVEEGPTAEKPTNNYNKAVSIPLPEVPPSVLQKETVDLQVREMREYFKAWQMQDTSHRNYKPYFRPILCILEGTWIEHSLDLTEPFDSDRHHIDAANWDDLNSRTQFFLQSGRKDNLENLPFLPSAMRDMKQTYDVYSDYGTGPVLSSLKYLSRFSRIYTDFRQTDYMSIDSIVVMPVTANEGMYIFVHAGRYPKGDFKGSEWPAGLVTNWECLSGECTEADIVRCGIDNNSGSRTDCPTRTSLYNSTNPEAPGVIAMRQNVFPRRSGHVVYGPFSGEFSVKLSLTEVFNFTVGKLFISENNYVDFDLDTPIVLSRELGESVPQFANFEYRIVCHPVKQDVPLNRFKPVDSLPVQMYGNPVSYEDLSQQRNAYHTLNPRDQDNWFSGRHTFELIDSLMNQIPGKDNYAANLTDTYNGDDASFYFNNDEPLNVGYYNRYYQVDQPDANGRTQKRRGFNSANLWVAKTTQEKVSPLRIETPDGIVEERWSWAVPLEIIYTTPLSRWNPWNLPERDARSEVERDGRNGGLTHAKAYDGTHSSRFYRTPIEFFSGEPSEGKDAADTAKDSVGVLDAEGIVRKTKASGHWIHFPRIEGIPGRIRQRYPILPLADTKDLGLLQGRSVKHALQSTDLAAHMLIGDHIQLGLPTTVLFTSESIGNGNFTDHYHTIQLTPDDLALLRAGESVIVASDYSSGHSHEFELRATRDEDDWVYTIDYCDDLGDCAHGHFEVCEIASSCVDVDNLEGPAFSPPVFPFRTQIGHQPKQMTSVDVYTHQLNAEDFSFGTILEEGVEPGLLAIMILTQLIVTGVLVFGIFHLYRRKQGKTGGYTYLKNKFT